VIDESLERRRLHNIRTILFVKQVLVTPTQIWDRFPQFLGSCGFAQSKAH